ncbi:MAG: TIR domain-containing protein [Chloroflexi bacterium]|nr:TIR domain-containing protein [Chloroflexota bacterium]
MIKRRIFISFDHDDTDQVNGFLGLRNIVDGVEFYNHKLDHRVNSRDVEYVRRVIREEYISPASVTVVLIGNQTAQSPWVKWEIQESLRQGKGILGIRLPGAFGPAPDGIPSNAVGGWDPEKFPSWIEWAFQQRQMTRS